jgi:hypothetical protein
MNISKCTVNKTQNLYELLKKNPPAPPALNLIFHAFWGKNPNAPCIFIMSINPTAAELKTTGQIE